MPPPCADEADGAAVRERSLRDGRHHGVDRPRARPADVARDRDAARVRHVVVQLDEERKVGLPRDDEERLARPGPVAEVRDLRGVAGAIEKEEREGALVHLRADRREPSRELGIREDGSRQERLQDSPRVVVCEQRFDLAQDLGPLQERRVASQGAGQHALFGAPALEQFDDLREP